MAEGCLKDAKHRHTLVVPPPPSRIPSNTDRIRFLDGHSKSNCTESDNRQATTAAIMQNEKEDSSRSESSPPLSSPFIKIEGMYTQPTTPTYELKSASSSPNSRSSNEEIKKEGEKPTTHGGQSSKDVIEIVTSVLKTREDSLAKYRKKFIDLRKHYDQKKAELVTVHDHVKELRKKIELLSQSNGIARTRGEDREKKQLEDQVNKLKLEIKSLSDEKEAASAKTSELTSTLNYTRLAFDGHKLLYELQNGKLVKCKKENSDLRQELMSQKATIESLMGRVWCLENALKEDVDDKNIVVEAFNLFMQKTQKRVTDMFGDKYTVTNTNDDMHSAIPPQQEIVKHEETRASDGDSKELAAAHLNQASPNTSITSAPMTQSLVESCHIKTEKPSLDTRNDGSSGEGQKRKETENDRGNEGSSSIFSCSENAGQKSSEQFDGQCKKKQRCE